MASVTRTLKLGTAICLVPERHPLALAKEVATIDYFSGGRFLFGFDQLHGRCFGRLDLAQQPGRYDLPFRGLLLDPVQDLLDDVGVLFQEGRGVLAPLPAALVAVTVIGASGLFVKLNLAGVEAPADKAVIV